MKVKSAKRFLMRNSNTISKINVGLEKPSKSFLKSYEKAMAALIAEKAAIEKEISRRT